MPTNLILQNSLVGSNHGKETARYHPSAEIRESHDGNTRQGFVDFLSSWHVILFFILLSMFFQSFFQDRKHLASERREILHLR